MAQLKPDYIKWVLSLNASQAQTEIHKLNKETKELERQNKAARDELARLEARGKKNSAEYKNLQEAIRQNNKLISENKEKVAELSKHLDLGSMTVKQLKNRLKDLRREFEDCSKAANPERYRELQRELEATRQALSNTRYDAANLRTGFASVEKGVEILKGALWQIGNNVLGFVTGAFKNAFNLVISFGQENSRLAAILGTTRSEIKDMEKAARDLGGSTSYSAAQVTQLQIELAKLGFARQDILDMEAGVLKFATAVGTDLASASAFAGAAMRIFKKDASEAEDVLATFAVATTKTALDFSFLQTSLSTIGPVAASFGFSLEDTVAVLGQLANAGFDASSAATATRNILLKLADSNGKLAQALGQPVKNSADLAAGLRKLRDEGIDLAKALELTDARSVAAFSTFLDNSSELDSLRDSISGVTKEFNAMADEMADNGAGALASLQSAAEELVLKIAADLEGPMKSVIDGLTSIVQLVGSVVAWLGQYGDKIKAVVIAFGSYKVAMWLCIGAEKTWLALKSAGTVAMKLWTAATKGAAVAMNVVRGNTVAATTAMTALSTAMKTIPWMAIISAVTSLAAMIFTLGKSEDEAAEKTDKLTDKTKDFNDALTEAQNNHRREAEAIERLVKVASNELESKEKRLSAIKELNKIIPDYNAGLNAETGAYEANKAALDEYIKSLKQKILLEAHAKKWKELVEADVESRDEAFQRWSKFSELADEIIMDAEARGAKATSRTTENGVTSTTYSIPPGKDQDYIQFQLGLADMFRRNHNMGFDAWYDTQHTESNERLKDYEEQLKKQGIYSDVVLSGSGTTTTTTPEDPPKNTPSNKVDRLKEIKKRLKELRKMEPESDAEYDEIREEIDKLTKEKKELDGKSSKKKHEKGTYSEDSINEALADEQDRHQKAMLKINKQKGDLSDEDYIIKRNEEIRDYTVKAIEALDKMRETVDEKHTETLDKITKEANKLAAEGVKAQQQINAATAKKQEESHKNAMEIAEKSYAAQEEVMKEAINNEQTTREAADIYLLSQHRQMHLEQLEELNRYYSEVEAADYYGAEQKRKRLEQIREQTKSINNKMLTDTGIFVQKMRQMTEDSSSQKGMKDALDRQVTEVEQTYAAMIKAGEEAGMDTVALEEAKQRKLRELNYKYLDQMYELQSVAGHSWAEEYDHELEALRYRHEQGIISEQQYQAARLKLQQNTAQKYHQYWQQTSSTMFSALQEAEIAMSEAKYDVLIQQAKNNGEETTQLEQDKENAKLAIQKKYADVNFAIKISEIVANTAVAIMKAFAELGPIGGAVAAAMLTATGIAQGLVAKAERDKVRNMQPGIVSASTDSSQTQTAERVLKTGYAEGGYTGDGDRYEVAGVVHRGEYVVPMPIMDNPRVIDAVGTIEAIRTGHGAGRRNAAPAEQLPGYADGGIVAGIGLGADWQAVERATRDLRKAAESIREVRAVLSYQDFERAARNMQAARAPFTRKS